MGPLELCDPRTCPCLLSGLDPYKWLRSSLDQEDTPKPGNKLKLDNTTRLATYQPLPPTKNAKVALGLLILNGIGAKNLRKMPTAQLPSETRLGEKHSQFLVEESRRESVLSN